MAKVNVSNFMSNVAGDSWVHRLDPRTKIAILFFFSTIPLFFTDFWFIAFFILLALPLWLTAGINFRPMIGPFLGIGVFLLVIFFLNAIRSPSELTSTDPNTRYTWFLRLGPIVFTSHTVTRGIFLALRLLVVVTIGLWVITTTDPVYLAKGLRKLGMPIAIVFMAQAGLRFLPIIMEQLYNILDALTIRGVRNSLVERTKLLMMPLFITSLRRTRTMGLACEAKGFGARRWNEFYEKFTLKLADKILVVALIIISIAALVVRFGFGLGTAQIGFIR